MKEVKWVECDTALYEQKRDAIWLDTVLCALPHRIWHTSEEHILSTIYSIGDEPVLKVMKYLKEPHHKRRFFYARKKDDIDAELEKNEENNRSST